jgi:excisionase family DNA binding protein
MQRTYTTRDAAARVGITRQTLQAWIAAGKVKAPKGERFGRWMLRSWTEKDLRLLKTAKREIYRKRAGRKKKRSK